MKRYWFLALAIGFVAVVAAAQDPNGSDPPAGSIPAPAGRVAEVGPTAGVIPGPLVPVEASHATMSGDDLFAKLLEYDRTSEAALHEYSSVRTYSVINDKGRTTAREVVQMTYHAPGRKTFVTKSGSGSSLIRDLVLDRLVQSEKESASGRAHRESEMKPENYTLKLIGEQEVGPYHCLVAEATPKRRDRFLFEGKIWISTDNYGIVRMAGRPAKPLSFWLTRADFVRQYQKIGQFWLPAEDETAAQIRFNGRKTMIVKYYDYQVNGAPAAQ